MTITYQTIINEINQIPIVSLPDIYSLIHSYNTKATKLKDNRDNILQFAGSWSSMADNEYVEIMSEINRTKTEMFSREVKL